MFFVNIVILPSGLNQSEQSVLQVKLAPSCSIKFSLYWNQMSKSIQFVWPFNNRTLIKMRRLKVKTDKTNCRPQTCMSREIILCYNLDYSTRPAITFVGSSNKHSFTIQLRNSNTATGEMSKLAKNTCLWDGHSNMIPWYVALQKFSPLCFLFAQTLLVQMRENANLQNLNNHGNDYASQ